MWEYNHNELYHYGVKGMKWGVRKQNKPSYKSTSIRSALARRSNEKIDKGFDDWKDNAMKKEDAVRLGKARNVAKIAYENNKSDKSLKKIYKDSEKEYKKALRQNTTYRKGVVRQEVGRDASRKYLSEAKKVKKMLDADPSNKQLKKQYTSLMNKHDIERADARKAVDVSTKRMRRVASMKRSMTIAVKSAATTAAVSAGLYATNKYLNEHEVTLNGERVQFSSQNLSDIASTAKKVRDFMGYFY